MLRKQGFINHRFGSGKPEICTNIPNPFERSKISFEQISYVFFSMPFFFLLFKNTKLGVMHLPKRGSFAQTSGGNVHRHRGGPGIQLAHAGRKASAQIGGERGR